MNLADQHGGENMLVRSAGSFSSSLLKFNWAASSAEGSVGHFKIKYIKYKMSQIWKYINSSSFVLTPPPPFFLLILSAFLYLWLKDIPFKIKVQMKTAYLCSHGIASFFGEVTFAVNFFEGFVENEPMN